MWQKILRFAQNDTTPPPDCFAALAMTKGGVTGGQTGRRPFSVSFAIISGMSLVVKRLETPQEMDAVRVLRTRVFVDEQGVPPELEVDELDDAAVHAVAFQDGVVIGTGRLILDTPSEARIGRMAVDESLRRNGIGAAVLDFLENEACSQGIKLISLHAQHYVRHFYANRGYQERGDTFMEAGILHVEMVKDIV